MRSRIVSMQKIRAGDLKASPLNWRKHPPRQMRILADSMNRLGFSSPVIARRQGAGYVLIDGHARVQLCEESDEIETVILDISEAQADELILLLDPISAMAIPDPVVLEELLERVVAGSDEVADLLQELAASAGLGLGPFIDTDEIPQEIPARTKAGELYELGRHRLLVGDATLPETYGRLLGDEQALMMFTDPPWNVAIGQDSNPRHRRRRGLANDDLAQDSFQAFLSSFIEAAAPKIQGDIYVVMSSSQWPALDSALRSAGLRWSATIVWVKDHFVLGRGNFHRRFEPIWYGWRDRSSFNGSRRLDDVWEEPRPTASKEHPTMKPVALVARAISASSSPGDLILDPFAGSGSTLLACEQLHRSCRAVEIDSTYADLVISRFETATGERARLVREKG